MVAQTVLDVATDGLRESVVVELVRSALADYDVILKLDEMFGARETEDHLNRPVAEAVRAMYESWSVQVDSLEQKIGRLEDSVLEGVPRLARAYGRTRAMLSISLDDIEESLRDSAEGRVYPLEEVRRELRARAH